MVTLQAKNLTSAEEAEEIETLRKAEQAEEEKRLSTLPPAPCLPLHSTRQAAAGSDALVAKDSLPDGSHQAPDSDESDEDEEEEDELKNIEEIDDVEDQEDIEDDIEDMERDTENVDGETIVWELCYDLEQCQPEQ